MIEIAEHENFLAGHTSDFPVIPTYPVKAVVIPEKKTLLAFPWYKSASPITSFCVAQLMDRRKVSSVLNFADAYIIHTRNTIVEAFLKTDLDYLLQIDDDMVVPCSQPAWFKAFSGFDWMPDEFAGLNTIDRLLSHKKTIVGALYFGRFKYGPPVFAQGNDPQIAKLARTAPIDRLLKVGWCGTGCLLTHRSVFLDIEKRFPRLARGADGKGGQWFSPSEHFVMDEIDRMRKMLSVGPMDGQKALKAYEIVESISARASKSSGLGQGEDVCLCKRAGEAGHETYVDLGLVAGHIGPNVWGPRNTFSRP